MAKKTMRKSRSRLTRRSHTKSGGGLKQWLEARKARKTQKKMEAAASIISPKNITPEVVTTREERLAKLKQARAAKNAALEKEALDALAKLDERLSSERKKPYQTNVNVQRMGKLTSKNWPPRKTPSSSSIKRKNKKLSPKKLSTRRFSNFEKYKIKSTGAHNKKDFRRTTIYGLKKSSPSPPSNPYSHLNRFPSPSPLPLYDSASSLRVPSYVSVGNNSLDSLDSRIFNPKN